MKSRSIARGLGTRLVTERLVLRPPAEEHALTVSRAIARNAEHLARVSPTTKPSASLVDVARRIASERSEWKRGTAYALYAFAKEAPARDFSSAVLAKVVLSGVHRGALEGAYLGYWVDQDHEGKGLAFEAVRAAVRFAFEGAGLHRVQAAIQAWNLRSVALAKRLGFRFEGVARRYLNVGGGWQDHEIYALTAEDWVFGPDR